MKIRSLFTLLGNPLLRKESFIRLYCSSSLQQQPSFEVAKRTSESNPSFHTEEQIGLFYKIPAETVDVLYRYGGFPDTFTENTRTFGETCLMIRSPAIEIFNYLKRADYSKPVIRYVIYGKTGCGKSLTLAHILHYAFVNNFIILHVPWVWDWFKNQRNEIVHSTTHAGCIDLPIISAQWLKHFQTQNGKLLSELELPIRNTYVWNQRENTPAGSHLSELVTHGINRIKFAADCILAVIRELKILSSENKCKCLIAVDGFNAMFGSRTNLYTEGRRKVAPSMVTLTKCFLEATKQDWTNSAVIVTVDKVSCGRHTILQSDLPLYLLGREGFEHLDPFIPVEIKEFTEAEFHSAMDYYEDRRWIYRTNGRHELSFITKNNPYQLMIMCGGY